MYFAAVNKYGEFAVAAAQNQVAFSAKETPIVIHSEASEDWLPRIKELLAAGEIAFVPHPHYIFWRIDIYGRAVYMNTETRSQSFCETLFETGTSPALD